MSEAVRYRSCWVADSCDKLAAELTLYMEHRAAVELLRLLLEAHSSAVSVGVSSAAPDADDADCMELAACAAAGLLLPPATWLVTSESKLNRLLVLLPISLSTTGRLGSRCDLVNVSVPNALLLLLFDGMVACSTAELLCLLPYCAARRKTCLVPAVVVAAAPPPGAYWSNAGRDWSLLLRLMGLKFSQKSSLSLQSRNH